MTRSRHLDAWHSVNQICWTAFGLLATADVGLFAASATLHSRTRVLGLVVSLIWWVVQYRAVQHLNWHAAVVARLDQPTAASGGTLHPSSVDRMKFLRGSLSIRTIWALLLPCAAVPWFALTCSRFLAGRSWGLIIAVYVAVLVGVIVVAWRSFGAWLQEPIGKRLPQTR